MVALDGTKVVAKKSDIIAKTAVKNAVKNGDEFEKLGKVIDIPKLEISGVKKHFVNRKIERGMTSEGVIKIFKNPKIEKKKKKWCFSLFNKRRSDCNK